MERIVRFLGPRVTTRFETIFRVAYLLKLRIERFFLNYLVFLKHPHPSEFLLLDFSNTKDFLYIPEIFSAKKHIYSETTSLVIFLVGIGGLVLLMLKFLFGAPILVIVSAFIAAFYFFLLVFKLIVVKNAVAAPLIDFRDEEIKNVRDEDLPVYTILVPLLKEAEVVPQIIKAMSAIDYPADKLDFIITLEEYDYETIDAIQKANPPSHFRTLILPNVHPKTKPKALNVAIQEAEGEFLVIYDAEIIPDPDQLKKAYLAFCKFPNLGILQTRLDHYNVGQNLLTKLFNAEYAFYYDLFLPGLYKFNYPIPLSGHSVHFRRSMIEHAGAWDPYNVTEDCEIGIRLRRLGYETGILNSISQEEATSHLKNWISQRTRWMKGFIQTSIVHLRHPLRFKNEVGGWKNFYAFLMTVPGTVLINLLNFIFWITLLLWFVTQSRLVQFLFPTPILYMSVISFIAGNFIFTYLNLLGIYKRNHYHLVKYILLSPAYWILLSIATMRAAVQMVTRPHHWEKTRHGDHLV